jgi:hypothetical protein
MPFNPFIMKSFLLTLTFPFGLLTLSNAQTTANQSSTTPIWTEADRKYLLDNLIRSKEELIKETKGLSKKQWNFKESADRWSINQLVEHLNRYELIFAHEISVALQIGPIPALHLPDSLFLDQDPRDLKKNTTTDYTKPFTVTVPLGMMEGPNNMIWFNTMRDESIDYVKTTTQNTRLLNINFGPRCAPEIHDDFHAYGQTLTPDKKSKSAS